MSFIPNVTNDSLFKHSKLTFFFLERFKLTVWCHNTVWYDQSEMLQLRLKLFNIHSHFKSKQVASYLAKNNDVNSSINIPVSIKTCFLIMQWQVGIFLYNRVASLIILNILTNQHTRKHRL